MVGIAVVGWVWNNNNSNTNFVDTIYWLQLQKSGSSVARIDLLDQYLQVFSI